MARWRSFLARVRRQHLIDANLIVAYDFELRSELADILQQVVGEGIVVIDHQDFHDSPSLSAQGSRDGSPASASATARKIARPLFMVSAHSFAGTES